MNLRELAPICFRSLGKYYEELLSIKESELSPGNNATTINGLAFNQLLKRCVYKLLNDAGASINCLPRIKNKLQLLEFVKLLGFICKFPNRINCKCNENANFEMFCLNFLHKFMLDADILDLRNRHSGGGGGLLTSSSASSVSSPPSLSSSTTKSSQLDTNDSDTLIDILDAFYQLVQNVLEMNSKFTQYFRLKLVFMLKTYFASLVDHFGQTSIMMSASTTILQQLNILSPKIPTTPMTSLTTGTKRQTPPPLSTYSPDTDDDGIFSSSSCSSSSGRSSSSSAPPLVISPQQLVNHADYYQSIDDYIYYRSKLIDYKMKLEKMETRSSPVSMLKEIARVQINALLHERNQNKRSFSLLAPSDCVYFQLPRVHFKLINYLTFNLIDDLYGANFDVEKICC